MSLCRTMKLVPLASVLALGVATTAYAKPPTASPAAAKPKPTVVAQATPPSSEPSVDAPKDTGSSDPAIQEARTRYNRGIELYNDGDYKLALIEFQRSYDLSPNWRILFNIGEVHYQLNNYASALKALEKYLADGGKDVPGKRKTDVEKDIEALKSRTAHVTITANVEGAEITIDDNPIGKSPLAPDLLTDAGSHRVAASKQGYRVATKLVSLAGREHQTITLELAADAKAAFDTVPQKESHTNYVWVGWAATGALAIGATVTGLMSLDAKNELDDMKGRQTTRQALDDQDSKRRTLGITTDILVGAAVVSAGVSLYFTLKGSGSGHSEGPKQGSMAKPKIEPRVGLGAVGVGGTF